MYLLSFFPFIWYLVSIYGTHVAFFLSRRGTLWPTLELNISWTSPAISGFLHPLSRDAFIKQKAANWANFVRHRFNFARSSAVQWMDAIAKHYYTTHLHTVQS